MGELATEPTLADLSWYAQAAYATRCARRVQPLYVTTNRDAREGLESVIVALEAFVQGTGGGYIASRFFAQTNFPDLSFEMAAAVYTSFATGQVCSAADNDSSIDDSTIPSKTYRTATTGRRAFERTIYAPGPEQRPAAVETYVATARPISSGVTEVLLNLGTRSETVVLHLLVEQVQAGLRGRY